MVAGNDWVWKAMETTLPPKYSLVLNMFFFSKLLMRWLKSRCGDGAYGAAHRHCEPGSWGEQHGCLQGVLGHGRHREADVRPEAESRHRTQRYAWADLCPGFFAVADRFLSAYLPPVPPW